MKPSVGRIVHYIQKGGKHDAAIITGLCGHPVGSLVYLAIFDRAQGVTLYPPYGIRQWEPGSEVPEEYKAGHDKDGSETWHWPERID